MTAPAFPAPLGVPPSIEQRAIDTLQVDTSYQRSSEGKDSLAMVRRIAMQWDWRLCAPLTVSRRTDPDGTHHFFVIDGQHRLMAARMRGDIPYLPCIISSFATVGEEAACFVSVNTARRAISVLDKFRARLAAGDAHALQVMALIEAAGLRLAPHSNYLSWPPLAISCVGGIGGALTRWGPDLTSAALHDIAAAFPSESLRYAGRILQGLYQLRAHRPADWDDAQFRAMLAKMPQSGWYAAMLRRQAKHGELPETAMHYALADAWAARKGAA